MTAPPSKPKREKSSTIETKEENKRKEKVLEARPKEKDISQSQKTKTQKSNTAHANRNTTESCQRGFFSTERTDILK